MDGNALIVYLGAVFSRRVFYPLFRRELVGGGILGGYRGGNK